MRLFEIPDYLNIKVRRKAWTTLPYIYFDKAFWVRNDRIVYCMYLDEPDNDDWEPYIEPKKKVKKSVDKWVNLYEGNVSVSYDTKEICEEHAGPTRLACQKVTFTYEIEE